jgi:uracil-DNA glycosylase
MMYVVNFDPRWQSWRERARDALLAQQPPDEVLWSPDEPDSQPLLPLAGTFGTDPARRPEAPAASAGSMRPRGELLAAEGPGDVGDDSRSFRVPADFVRTARLVAHHRSAGRWDLLYRLLWRLQHGEPSLLDDMLDPDVFRFRRMAAAVRDDLKETRAQLHFWSPAAARPMRRAGAEPPRDGLLPDMVSWCQPHHRVLALLAEDFTERYPDRSFALLSPDGCAFWDTRSLELGPGMDRKAAHSPSEIGLRWAERRQAAA